MSFDPRHPSRFGLVIPEDLLTGALRPDETFAFDGVIDWSGEDPTTIARHPVELGKKSVTDARLKSDPQRLPVTFLLTDTPEEPSPWARLKDVLDQDTVRGSLRTVGTGIGAGAAGTVSMFDPRKWSANVDRCVRRRDDFLRFAARNEPCTVSVPGKTLRRMGIGAIRDRPHPSGVGLLSEVQFEELRIVTLRSAAQIPDADLAAAGFGGGGAGGTTFVEVGVFGGG